MSRPSFIKEILWKPFWGILSLLWSLFTNLPTVIFFVEKLFQRDYSWYAKVLLESPLQQFFSNYWIFLLIIFYLAAIAEGMYRKVVDLTVLPVKARFKLEPVRDSFENLVGIRLHSEENVDITNKKAELIGFGKMNSDGEFYNLIDNIQHENRILSWFEPDNKIEYRGHGLIKVAIVNETGVRLCLINNEMNLGHNADQKTLKISVEIRGELGEKSIVPRQCCITFSIRKNILDNNKIRWAIDQPTLEEGLCNWVKTISADEFLAKL